MGGRAYGVGNVIRRRGAGPSPGQAAEQGFARHVHVQRRGHTPVVELGEHRIERLGLGAGAREAVEDGAFGRVGLPEAVGDHLDGEGSRGTRAPDSEVALDLLAECRGAPDVVSKRSPDATWGMPSRSDRSAACVPLPAPGAPTMTYTLNE